MQKLTHAEADTEVQILALQYHAIILSCLGAEANHDTHGDEQQSANLIPVSRFPEIKALIKQYREQFR